MFQYRDFTLRPATIQDMPELSSLISDIFDEYGWIFVEKDELPDFVDFHRHYGESPATVDELRDRLFVVESGSGARPPRTVGCIALKYNAEGPFLSRVYLRPSVRGIGLGRHLTEYIMDLARKQGLTSIHLWTDTKFLDAHRMYERIGFRFTGTLRSLHDTNRCFEWKMAREL